MKDVFLSHSHVDAEAVHRLACRLVDEANLSVWLDRWECVPGRSWQMEMAEGLDQARSCAVCLGETTPQQWFREEIQRALHIQTRNSNFRVIPVLLPGGTAEIIDGFLEQRTWVDFRDGLEDGLAFHRLVSGIKNVPPGRYPRPNANNILSELAPTIKKLEKIKFLRLKDLIGEDIALEATRRVVNQMIGRSGKNV